MPSESDASIPAPLVSGSQKFIELRNLSLYREINIWNQRGNAPRVSKTEEKTGLSARDEIRQEQIIDKSRDETGKRGYPINEPRKFCIYTLYLSAFKSRSDTETPTTVLPHTKVPHYLYSLVTTDRRSSRGMDRGKREEKKKKKWNLAHTRCCVVGILGLLRGGGPSSYIYSRVEKPMPSITEIWIWIIVCERLLFSSSCEGCIGAKVTQIETSGESGKQSDQLDDGIDHATPISAPHTLSIVCAQLMGMRLIDILHFFRWAQDTRSGNLSIEVPMSKATSRGYGM